MSDLKWQLEQRLITNILMEKCASNSQLIIRDAWCTQDRILRFTTPFFRRLFQPRNDSGGYWKTGDAVMYEVEISCDLLTVNCLLYTKDLFLSSVDIISKMKTCIPEANFLYSLNRWVYPSHGNTAGYFSWFDDFVHKDLCLFEKEVAAYLIDTEKAQFQEGKSVDFTGQKYERNPRARAACLAYYGNICAICGMDFEHIYGPEFADIIEVHHIVPLSQIGAEYNVDPIQDLIPVCPNCHTVLHHREGDVYSVEEIKQRLFRYSEK